jgi:hypothetical protein
MGKSHGEASPCSGYLGHRVMGGGDPCCPRRSQPHAAHPTPSRRCAVRGIPRADARPPDRRRDDPVGRHDPPVGCVRVSDAWAATARDAGKRSDPINLPSATSVFFAVARRPKFLLTLIGAQHLPPYTTLRPQLAIIEQSDARVPRLLLERSPSRGAARRLGGRRRRRPRHAPSRSVGGDSRDGRSCFSHHRRLLIRGAGPRVSLSRQSRAAPGRRRTAPRCRRPRGRH